MKNKFLISSLSIVLLVGFFLTVVARDKDSKLKKTTTNNDLITIDIDKANIKNTILFSEIFKQIRIVPLETNRDCLIGNIDKMLIENDTIYVLDEKIARSLFVFDNNGKFIRKIGKLGNGPGEYRKPRSFSIDTENKRINIYGVGKILNYTLSGVFIRNIRTDNYSVIDIANQNGIIYVDHSPFMNDKDGTLLTAFDTDGKVLNTWLPNSKYTHGFQQQMTTMFDLVETPKDIKYIRPFFDTIFCIDNRELVPFISFETKNIVTQSEMNKINSIPIMELSKYLFPSNTAFYQGPLAYAENKRLIMIQLKIPGNVPYCLLNPKNKNYVFGLLEDDLTGLTLPLVITVTDDSYVFTTNMSFTNIDLIEKVKNGSIKLDKVEKEKVLRLKPDNNPVIMFYECREDFLSN